MTVVDIDGGAEEKIVAVSQGSATGLNLRENQKIYFGGLPTIGNYRYLNIMRAILRSIKAVSIVVILFYSSYYLCLITLKQPSIWTSFVEEMCLKC